MIGDVDDFPTVDDAVNALTTTILSAVDSSIPNTKGGLKTKCVPWWTPDLGRNRREKNDKLRQYRRSSLIFHKIEFMRARAKFRKSVKESRRQSWQDFVSSINAQTPIAKIWKKVDKIRGKYTTSSPILNGPNGQVADRLEVANIFGQSLGSISRGSQHPDFLRIKDRYTPPALDGDDMAEYNLPFTAEE